MEQNEEMLKCEIVHKGYDKQQLKAGINLIETQLNLNFKASFSDPEVEENTVKILFKSNPKPTRGQWLIGEEIKIPFGWKNGTFQASEILEDETKNEYEVHLNYTLNDKLFATLEVVNDLGTAAYSNIEICSSGDSLLIVVILIIILVVTTTTTTYYVFIKKLLCFSVHEKGSLWDEEKGDSSMTPLVNSTDAADGTKRKVDTQTDIVDFKAEQNPMLETEAKNKSNAEDILKGEFVKKG